MQVHERTVDSDFLIIILRDLIATRKDLHLVLMSATLNAEVRKKMRRQWLATLTEWTRFSKKIRFSEVNSIIVERIFS